MKKVNALVVSALLCAVLSVPGAFASGQGEEKVQGASGPVELRFTVWTGNEAHLKLLNGIAEAYKAKKPNVSVKFDTIPFGEYVQKITLQLAGSNAPDAGWIAEAAAPTFVAAGTLLDLSSAVAAYDYADFSKPTLKLWERDGSVYGVPFSTSPFLMYYNASLFKSAGVKTPTELIAAKDWTWTAFARIAKEIKDKTGIWGFQTMDGTGFTERNWHTLVPIMRAYGGDAWNARGECLLDSPGSVKAAQLFHDMVFVDKSVVPPGDQSDFFAGAAAMTMNQISRVSKLEGASFEWGLAPLPAGPAGESQVIGQAAIVAFKASKHPAEAADFVAFMTNKENVSALAAFFPPARVSVLDSDAFAKGNPAVAPETMKNVVGYALKRGEVLPSHVNFPKIDLIARAGFDQLWRPDVDVADIMGLLASKISPLLK